MFDICRNCHRSTPIDSNLVTWSYQETSEGIFNSSLERNLNHDPGHTHGCTGWWAPNLDPPLPLEAHSPKTPGPRPLMNHQATPRGPTKDKANCRRLPLIFFSHLLNLMLCQNIGPMKPGNYRPRIQLWRHSHTKPGKIIAECDHQSHHESPGIKQTSAIYGQVLESRV